ncbi:MAG: ECF transporter S component [Firmicutes bacterium]|nr:ECF transporter S component [Bacillota bacterium]
MATKNSEKTREMVMAALCLALALLLPFLTGQIKEIGNMLCPMHIPVLLCAFLCSWKWAAGVGAAAPLLRSAIWGMPPMGPIAFAMTFELATYGLIASVIYRRLPKKTWSIYIALIAAMLGGRIVWGIVSMILYGAMGTPFTWQMFAAGAFINAVPGIILQIVIIPVIVLALEKAGVVRK